MQYCQLGRSNMEISLNRLWLLGDGLMEGEDVVDNNFICAVHQAVDVGINFFDTADDAQLPRQTGANME